MSENWNASNCAKKIESLKEEQLRLERLAEQATRYNHKVKIMTINGREVVMVMD